MFWEFAGVGEDLRCFKTKFHLKRQTGNIQYTDKIENGKKGKVENWSQQVDFSWRHKIETPLAVKEQNFVEQNNNKFCIFSSDC